jgi:hypothetical protein
MVPDWLMDSQGEPRGAKGSAPLAPLGEGADAFGPKMGGNKPPFGQKQHRGGEKISQGEAPNFLRAPLGGTGENGVKGSQGENFVDDDRVECKDCRFFKQEMATQNFQGETWDKLVRVNHPANRWMFELVKVRNGWASVSYPQMVCKGGEPAPMPMGLKHRCDYFEGLDAVADVGDREGGAAWWE